MPAWKREALERMELGAVEKIYVVIECGDADAPEECAIRRIYPHAATAPCVNIAELVALEAVGIAFSALLLAQIDDDTPIGE